MNSISILGLVAAILTTSAFVPQVYKTVKSQSAKDLSLSTFSMLLVGTMFWFIYGYFKGDFPIMLANGITGFLTGVIFFIKIKELKKRNI